MRLGRRTRGFTLVELAVVLAIVGLLLGAMMLTLSAQVEIRDRGDTQRRLDDAKELLLGFAIVNGHLPCPASCANPPACTTGSGGDEDRSATLPFPCVANSGFLPARAIGFQPTSGTGFALDAWGNPIRYAVASTVNTTGAACPAVDPASSPSLLTTYWSPPFTTATATGLPNSPTFMKANGVGCPTGDNDLLVCSWAQVGSTCATAPPSPPGASASVANQNTVVAVVLSTGKNGAQGAAGTNEAENTDGDNVFVYRPPDPNTAAGGEYDDMTVWIPVGLLYGRLTAAGVLP